jgi:hypothetical protein
VCAFCLCRVQGTGKRARNDYGSSQKVCELHVFSINKILKATGLGDFSYWGCWYAGLERCGPLLRNYWTARFLFCVRLNHTNCWAVSTEGEVLLYRNLRDIVARCWSLISQEDRGTRRMFRSAAECHDQCSWSHSNNPQTIPSIRANISYRCLTAIEENHRRKPNILMED